MSKPREHRYTACRDKNCDRPLCVAYREGLDDGFADGYIVGVQSCPGTHV
jgi:hypothetical protein